MSSINNNKLDLVIADQQEWQQVNNFSVMSVN